MKRIARYAVCLLLTFLFLCGVLYVIFVWMPVMAVRVQTAEAEKVVSKVQGALSSLFNMPSESKDRTISFRITETNSIYELSTVSRKFTHSYEYSTKWLGSTKSIFLIGDYEAKAGIDLSTPLKIQVSLDGKLVSIQLPKAKITSMTTLDEGAVKEKSGYWNRISSEDKELALKALRKDAERVLKESDILRQAEQRCFEQIRARLEAGILDPGVQIRTVGQVD